ncbi:acyl carrier protein [Streptomyces sp. NPDC019531]|uniref:acyl carrier protein n=1 Tax=Streptomyces sp. NPDC019531 TaxID=3365062 RepID=UPI00384BDBAC
MTLLDEEISTEALIIWLTQSVAQYADMSVREIDPDVLLSDYGLDSVSAVAVLTEIEDAFGVVPDVTVVWDHPTIRALASFLADFIRAERQ